MADFETEDITLADFLKMDDSERERFRMWANKKLYQRYRKIHRKRRQIEQDNGIIERSEQ